MTDIVHPYLHKLDEIRKSIKERVDRSDDIIEYSGDMLDISCMMYKDPSYVLRPEQIEIINGWNKQSKLITDDDFVSRDDLTEEYVYDKLMNECRSHRDTSMSSVYGYGVEHGQLEHHRYVDCFDPYTIEPSELRFVLHSSHCGTLSDTTKVLCDKCSYNFHKIKHFMNEGELYRLAIDWNAS